VQNSSFQYNVLPTARSIRLVRIHGSDRDSDDVYCTIETHPLDSHPPYAALSYTWGSQKSKKIIHCNNDSVLLVTQNLWRALRRLKPQLGDDRTLWIDAICISPDRHRTKCCRNLRFRPQFCEGFGFCLGAEKFMLRAFKKNSSVDYLYPPCTETPPCREVLQSISISSPTSILC
jgi:Heterokaryon incompatibility protein (HET)